MRSEPSGRVISCMMEMVSSTGAPTIQVRL
jgi:hypothetical protein